MSCVCLSISQALKKNIQSQRSDYGTPLNHYCYFETSRCYSWVLTTELDIIIIIMYYTVLLIIPSIITVKNYMILELIMLFSSVYAIPC